MPVVVILLSVILMFFMALASAVQRTIHTLGLRRPRGSESPAEARALTFILLGVYLRWVNVVFLLAMAMYLVISRASAWYHGLAIVALCWIGSLLMRGIALLQPGSTEMVALLVADLERRRSWYQVVHNAVGLHAIEDLLTRLQSVPKISSASDLHR